MTKGKALLEARKILGPSAHVRYKKGLPLPCVVGTLDGSFRGVAVGVAWENALATARRRVQEPSR